MDEEKKYKVKFWQDDTYEVLEEKWESTFTTDGIYWEQVYKGSLADCEAYIRLHENGYMD
jgi:hypothetical protein